jgi:hypothetical protein
MVAAACGCACAQESPVYAINRLGLVSPEYQAGTGRTRSLPSAASTKGLVVGTSTRLSATEQFYGNDAWLFNGSTTIGPLNLTGGDYENPLTNPIYRAGWPIAVDEAGRVAGASLRFGWAGENIGYDAWLFDGVDTRRINPIDGDYQWPGVNGVERRGGVRWFRNGLAVGTADRKSQSGALLGCDAFLFNGSQTIVPINLRGPEYEQDSPNGVYRSLVNAAFGDLLLSRSGIVAGVSLRTLPSLSQDAGSDAWVFNGTSTIGPINLTGHGYQTRAPEGHIFRRGERLLMNDSGVVAGLSWRFHPNWAPLGSDAWVHRNGVTTGPINLVGAPYERDSNGLPFRVGEARRIDNAGAVTGSSSRFSPSGADLGSDVWLHHDGVTVGPLNLVGSPYEFQSTYGLMRGGQAYAFQPPSHPPCGYSTRFATDGTTTGRDCWVFRAGSTVGPVNLTGGPYEWSSASTPFRHSEWHGGGRGTSTRYSASGATMGQDC